MTMNTGQIRSILPMATVMGEIADNPNGDWVAVDLLLTTVSVHQDTADRWKDRLVAALDDGIGPEYGTSLQEGPSYIHLGAELGDQGYALCLMALGHVLGLWTIMDGRSVGFPTEEARVMAGGGFLYAIGWKRPVEAG